MNKPTRRRRQRRSGKAADGNKLVVAALDDACFFPALLLRGLRPRQVKITLYPDAKDQYSLIVLYQRHRKRLREAKASQAEAIPLVDISDLSQYHLLGLLPLGFRVSTVDRRKFVFLRRESAKWVQYIENPREPTSLSF
jgi:hypothetical protein